MEQEKIVFSKKCDKCRCKNAMTEEEVMWRMHPKTGGKGYTFWCWGRCRTEFKISEDELPHKIVKKLRRQFKK